jgi:hypothetical protein
MQTKKDWRLQAYGELAEGFISPWTGQAFAKGSSFILICPIQIRKNKILNIPIPNASASCLNISKKCWNDANILRNSSNIDSVIEEEVYFPTDEEAINYIELIMQSVIFAFTALEAFVNEVIPDSYEYTKTNNKCKEIYNKSEIERWLSIEEKIGQVLPSALGIPTPKGRHNSWNEFQKLKKVRDRLIHMKSEDRQYNEPEQKTIWRELIKTEPPYQESFSVIKYFIETAKLDFRWFDLGKEKLTK